MPNLFGGTRPRRYSPSIQAVRVENAAGDSTPYGKKSTRTQEAIAPALVYGSQLVT